MNLDEHLQDRQAFELALLRVRGRAVKEGRTPTHGEMLKEAQKELEEENRRLAAEIASLKQADEKQGWRLFWPIDSSSLAVPSERM